MSTRVGIRDRRSRLLVLLLLAVGLSLASAVGAQRAEALSVFNMTFCPNSPLDAAGMYNDKCLAEYYVEIEHVRGRYDPSPNVRVCAGAKDSGGFTGGNAIAFQCADGVVD